MHKFLFIISLLHSCTCFEHCCAHHQEVKIVLCSIWYRHTYRWASRSQVESLLYMFRTRAHHQEVKIALHNLWYHHTYRWASGAQVERGLSTCFEHCCAHHQEVKIVLYSIWYHHTYRWASRSQVEILLYMFRAHVLIIRRSNFITQPLVSSPL